MDRRVVITGMGWVTPLGHDIESVWKRLLLGESGVAPTALFDAGTFPTDFAAEVKDFDLNRFLGDEAKKHEGASRNSRFALAAAETAWKHAGFAPPTAAQNNLPPYQGGTQGGQTQDSTSALFPPDPTRVGIYLGGGEGPLDFQAFARAAVAGCVNEGGEVGPLDTARWGRTAVDVLNPVSELEQDPNLAGGHLAVRFNAQGPNINTLTACAASTQAIGEAFHLIRYGDADVMISGGTHSMIHPLGVTGFIRLTALSKRNDSCLTASRPFDRTRDGFVLGEGSGILILEELEHAKRRDANILAEIVGYGSTADAFRITDIHEDGRGAIAAMRAALKSAGLAPSDIQYISAHGTSTQENDKAESLAVKQVFGDLAKQVPISSVKSMIGHLIAAAGAVELITCVLAIRDGIVPPTMNYKNPDPACDLDYVPNAARKTPVSAALSNSFGFGGQNDTLAIRAFPG